jgi:hypothetical protein
VFWTVDQITYPYNGEVGTVFITTRISSYTEFPNRAAGCTNFTLPTSVACSSGNGVKTPLLSYYVANVENINFEIDHTVRYQPVNTFGSSSLSLANSVNMPGQLKSICESTQSVFKTFDDGTRSIQRERIGNKFDIITLSELLGASNCNDSLLDKGSKAEGVRVGETIRSAGATISMPIYYENRNNAGDGIKYSYIPAMLQSNWRITEAVNNFDGSITYNTVNHSLMLAPRNSYYYRSNWDHWNF